MAAPPPFCRALWHCVVFFVLYCCVCVYVRVCMCMCVQRGGRGGDWGAQVNTTYLGVLETIVNQLGARGIYTILDAHQDVWHPRCVFLGCVCACA